MIIHRRLYDLVQNHIGEQKVILIYGTRRTGKTTLARAIYALNESEAIWMNGEDMVVQSLLSNRSAANYKSVIGTKQLLIIDEAQAIPMIGSVLKLMIDEVPNLTVIATGSSSLDLINETGEPLVGRSYKYHLHPFSQQELGASESRIDTITQLEQRMIYGSYPELWQLEGQDEKETYLKSLISSYLLKDILAYAEVKGASILSKLLQLLAWQVGSTVSTSELGRNLNVKSETVERYLDLLSKVFVIFPLGGFSRNLRKEVAKSKKWYFYDNGIRNALINDFRPLEFRNDVGQLWEQYVISERIKFQEVHRNIPERYYWRTYDQQEIDLIEIDSQRRMDAFELKWGKQKARPPLGFSRNYPEAKFHVVSRENYLEYITD